MTKPRKKKPPARAKREEPIDRVVQGMKKAFGPIDPKPILVGERLLDGVYSVLQSFEVTWHHEQECDDFTEHMGKIARGANELCKQLEAILNANGIPTMWGDK